MKRKHELNNQKFGPKKSQTRVNGLVQSLKVTHSSSKTPQNHKFLRADPGIGFCEWVSLASKALLGKCSSSTK